MSYSHILVPSCVILRANLKLLYISHFVISSQKKCWLEPKEKCVKLPKKECWDEPWEDCWDEKKEVCHNYSVRSCQPVPNKECVKVTVKRPREVCIPEATKTKTKVEEW